MVASELPALSCHGHGQRNLSKATSCVSLAYILEKELYDQRRSSWTLILALEKHWYEGPIPLEVPDRRWEFFDPYFPLGPRPSHLQAHLP